MSFAIIIDIFRSFRPLLGQAHEDAYRFSLPYMIRAQVPCHYGKNGLPKKWQVYYYKLTFTFVLLVLLVLNIDFFEIPDLLQVFRIQPLKTIQPLKQRRAGKGRINYPESSLIN